MPPSPTPTPWVLEVEDPASVHPELLDPPAFPPTREHDRAPVAVPTTPVGGRRACCTGLRVRADRARDWARRAQRETATTPRHRGEPAELDWASLARRARHPQSRSIDRATLAVVSTCAVIGVWLGVLAPATSPLPASPEAGTQQSAP